MTSTVATGGFDEVFAPPDEELAVVPGLREAEFSSSTELRRVADEPSRDADLGGADCVGRCCTVVGGRESLDLTQTEFLENISEDAHDHDLPCLLTCTGVAFPRLVRSRASGS